MDDKLTRTIRWIPAYDRRDRDPKKNYGIHGMTLGFYLSGPEGAIQFVIYTNWHLKHVQEEMDLRPSHGSYPHITCHPMPADIGYHSKVPRYEGQTPMDSDCEWTGGTCYYDGSGLNAEPIYWRLVAEGDTAVWEEMGRYYNDRLRPPTDPEVEGIKQSFADMVEKGSAR